jgi:hypothetical protein
MKKLKKYNGTYTDNFGTTGIIIENDFKNLYTEIDGVKFSGSEFAGLFIIDKAKYTDGQLKRFTFFSTPIYNTTAIVEEGLCNCVFNVSIPQLMIDKRTGSEFYINLKLEYLVGNAKPKPKGGIDDEKINLFLVIEDNLYAATSGLLEGAFDQIRKQLKDKYHFKNCYGCMFGDYSVYGQSGFGTMLCFVAQKENYKKITGKNEYMELAKDEIATVQEIYCCDKFEIRTPGAGYRG